MREVGMGMGKVADSVVAGGGEDERRRRAATIAAASVTVRCSLPRQSRRERERERRTKDSERDFDKAYQRLLREFELREEQRIKLLRSSLRDLETSVGLNSRDKRKLIEADLSFGLGGLAEECEWKRCREEGLQDRQRERERDAADRRTAVKEITEKRWRSEEEKKRRGQAEREEAAGRARLGADEDKRSHREALRRQKQVERRRLQKAVSTKLINRIREELQRVPEGSLLADLHATTGGVLFGECDHTVGSPRPVQKRKAPVRLEWQSNRDSRLAMCNDVHRLIAMVPTDREGVFGYDIDWQVVHEHGIIEKRLSLWIRTKLLEYRQSDEPRFVDFIVGRVTSQASPSTLLAQLDGFLGDDTERFVLGMWRTLIFEVLRASTGVSSMSGG